MVKILGRRIPLTLILAAAGIGAGLVFTTTYGKPASPPPNQLAVPPANPFAQTVSGTGVVEASSRNIELGIFVPGVIASVTVSEGDKVKQGDVLMAIDSRSARADLASARAKLQVAEAALADEEDQLKRIMSLKGGEAISIDQQQRRSFSAKRARAGFAEAKAAAASAQVTLDKHSITSPIDGEVLKVRVRPGEFADSNGPSPITVGNTNPLYLRVQIDENDLWRYGRDAKATAFLRSNAERQYALSFVRAEPLVQPKKQLSGATSEQVDTRIMEVVYEIAPLEGAPLYVGQQLDVFIEGVK